MAQARACRTSGEGHSAVTAKDEEGSRQTSGVERRVGGREHGAVEVWKERGREMASQWVQIHGSGTFC